METVNLGNLGESSTVTNVVYIAEDETGYCRLFLYSNADIDKHGGLTQLEASLCAEFAWFECLGTIPVHCNPDGSFSFSQTAVQRLVVRCSRRMALTPNPDELEYLPLDWPKGSLN